MATGGGGTIGAANIELGVDTSKLDAGMAAAKSSVESQTASMETIAANLGGDEDRYQGALAAQEELRYREALANLSKRTQSETTAALLEEDSYKKRLFEMDTERRESEAAALAEEQRYQQKLRDLRKAQLVDEQEITNWKKQGLQTQQQTTTATQQTAAAVNNIAEEGQRVVGTNGFMSILNGDLKEATKLFSAFGKLAIFQNVATTAYGLGQAIRENIIELFTTGTERAKEFAETVNQITPKERANEYAKRLEEVNGQLALMSEFQSTDAVDPTAAKTWSVAIDGAFNFLKGKTRGRLEEERRDLEERLRTNLQGANAIDLRNKQIEENKRREAAKTETFRTQLAATADEQTKLELQFFDEKSKLEKRLASEKDAIIKSELAAQLVNLQTRFDNESQKLRDQSQTTDRLRKIAEENEAARIALIQDPRKRAEAEFQNEKQRIEKQIRDEQDAAVQAELQKKLTLLGQTHAVALANIDREANEKQKADAKIAQQQAAQLAEQFAQLRGEINSMFNAGNIEVGINRLGSLLEVLIQKTGDGR